MDDEEKKKKIKAKKRLIDQINKEIKKSVAAVLLLGLVVILLLARFDQAGPAGQYLFLALNKTFGWGYYLLPLTSLLLAIVFLSAKELEVMAPSFIAAIVFIISSLGLIDIIFPEKGGLVGNFVGLIKNLFGYSGSLVIIVMVMTASLIITLNVPLQIKLKKKEDGISFPDFKTLN